MQPSAEFPIVMYPDRIKSTQTPAYCLSWIVFLKNDVILIDLNFLTLQRWRMFRKDLWLEHCNCLNTDLKNNTETSKGKW